MKKWKVPVSWEMCGIAEIKADTLEEAMDIAQNSDEVEIPDGEYVDGSFCLSIYEEDVIRKTYNKNMKDD